MEYIPDKNCPKKLYFDGKLNESKFIALHGIKQLVKMYAGRGGALNVNKLTEENKNLLVSYLDSLYWTVLRESQQQEFEGKRQQERISYSSLPELNFFQKYTQESKVYDSYVFRKVFVNVLSSINSLKTKIYKVHMMNTITLYKNRANLFEEVQFDEGSAYLGFSSTSCGVRFILTENMDEADYFIVTSESYNNYTDEQLSRTLFFGTEPCFSADKHCLGTEKKTEPFKFLKYYDYYDTRVPNCLENQLQTAPSDLFTLKYRIAQVIEEDIDRKILGEDGMNLLRLATSRRYTGRHGGVPLFSKILYTGVRYVEFKRMIENRMGSALTCAVKFEYFEGLCGSIPNGVPLMQEFSNALPNSQNLKINQYTIGHSRFSIKNFNYKFPKTFVVNLARRKDRYKKFGLHFPGITGSWACTWPCERFDAVDGKLLKIDGEFPPGIKHLFRNNDFGWKEGVIGCAMSHIKLWQTLVADDENESYIIYEDDVEFAENYTWKLYSVLEKITFDWDMLFLGHLVRYELQTDHRVENDELPNWEMMSDYIIPERKSWVGTASYIISKRGAQKLLDYIEKNGVGHGIDYLIQLQFPDLLRAYGVRPMLNFAEYASPLNPNVEVDSDVQI